MKIVLHNCYIWKPGAHKRHLVQVDERLPGGRHAGVDLRSVKAVVCDDKDLHGYKFTRDGGNVT